MIVDCLKLTPCMSVIYQISDKYQLQILVYFPGLVITFLNGTKPFHLHEAVCGEHSDFTESVHYRLPSVNCVNYLSCTGVS